MCNNIFIEKNVQSVRVQWQILYDIRKFVGLLQRWGEWWCYILNNEREQKVNPMSIRKKQ